MKLSIVIIFFSLVASNYSQQDAQKDSVVDYYKNGKIKSIIYYSKDVREGEAKYFWENGNIKEERPFVNDKVEGLVKLYYESGKLKEMFNIENGKREGPTTYFDSTGTHTEDIFFEEGLRKGQDYVLIGEYRQEDYEKLLAQWKERQQQKNNKQSDLMLPPLEDKNQEMEDDPAYYINVEVMPEPIGGMSTIYKKLTYPKEAIEKEIEGTVKILAFIESNGEVSSATVVEGIGYGCDENARLAVYYTRFKPGLMRGKRVKVQIEIPIEFKLDKQFK